MTPKKASPQELPTWRIPNVPSSAEAYYAPDSYHVIAQTQDPDALVAPGRKSGALTWIFSDDGKTKWRIIDIKLIPVALTEAQCIEFQLPRTPLKDTTSRQWVTPCRRGQV